MARPINADAHATRARILAAATRLFADRGMDGASVRVIASGANVSLATVHHYFGSKADLYQSCVDSLYADLAQLRRDIEPAALAGGDLGALVEQAIRTAYRFARNHRDQIRILMRRILADGSLEPRWQDHYQGPLLDRGAQLVTAVTGHRPRQARLVLQSMLNLIVRYALSSLSELSLFTGLPLPDEAGDEHTAALLEAVEEHLVEIGSRLLLTAPATR